MPSRRLALICLIVLLVAVPLFTALTGKMFLLSLATRIAALAMAAIALQLIMGHAGLISLGHAAFVGLGGYVVGVCAALAGEEQAWLTNGFLQLGFVVVVCGAVAFVTGLVSLRTRGMYFLMITLAFAQMLYLGAIAAYPLGGEDGMTIYALPRFPGLDLTSPYQRYAMTALTLVAATWGLERLVRSPFGLALRAAGSNEVRSGAVGYEPVRLRLVAYVVAGVVAGVAGMLLAVHTEFVSPAMFHWTRSGDLVIMVVLGGLRTVGGPILGAAVLLLLEELLSSVLTSWQIVVGLLLLVLARYAPEGLGGLFRTRVRNG